MKRSVILTLLVVSAALSGMASAQTEVRWFVGLGAGSDEPTIAPQQTIVDEYNASQNEIKLVLEIVDAAQAQDVLATQIAAGNPPDIVGPMGIQGRAAFEGAWLDLTDLIQKTGYDLSDFDPALVEFYKLGDQGQLGIPFAVYLRLRSTTKTFSMRPTFPTRRVLTASLTSTRTATSSSGTSIHCATSL